MNDGLSQVTISTICQDEKSRMWIATLDGLNCYDGNRIKVFNHFHNDSISFGNLYVTQMVESESFLYLLTSTGVFAFNLSTEQYHLLPITSPTALAKGKHGIWIAEGDHIYQYQQKTNQLKRVHSNLELPLTNFDMLEDSNGNLYLAREGGGVICIDNQGTVLQVLQDVMVMKFLLGYDQNIWIGTQEDGIFCLSPQGQVIHQYHPRNDMARALCQDFEGNIWVGYRSGLAKIEVSTGNMLLFQEEADHIGTMIKSSVTSLYTDSQGIVWVGTYWGGVSYFLPEHQHFDFYRAARNELSFSVVGNMTEDSQGNIWICTEGGGLNLYHPDRKKIKHFNFQTGTRFSSDYLKDIVYDKYRDCLWIAADFSNKINRFYPASQDLSVIPLPIEAGVATFSLADTSEKLYIGTTDAVVCLDKATLKSDILFKEKNLFTHNYNMLLFDSKGRLWFATDNGCASYSIVSKKIKVYKIHFKYSVHSAKELVNVLFEDRDGNIWLGTHGNGLFLLNEKASAFLLHTNPEMFSGGNIRAISSTPSGNLLIGTGHGLSVLSKTDGNIMNFSSKAGFPLPLINHKAILIASDGNIYMGGNTGMAIMQEDYLQYPRRIYNVLLTDLYVDNKEVTNGTPTDILKNSFTYTDKIKLNHSQNVFSIVFSTDNYLHTGGGEILYRLKGYDEEWHASHIGNTATYTNIPPGNYTFEICMKEYPEVTRALQVIIVPPFYATWWAYTLYICIVLAILFIVIREYKIRLYLKTSLSFELREKQHLEEMNQSKLRFFTNISHEIRTPITLIIGQVELLLSSGKLSSYTYSKLLNIHKNAANLKLLLTELLDFRKQEQGKLQLKVFEFDLYALLKEQHILFKELSVNRNITFSLDSDCTRCLIWGDRFQLQKVINNLLSNAFKHTEDGGKITLNLTDETDSCSFSVSDNGSGISEENCEKIFERFYQIENIGKEGTGIGLALSQGIIKAHQGEITVKSQLNQGAVFKVTLKKSNSHFPVSTLCTEPEQPKEYIYHPEEKDAIVSELQSSGSSNKAADGKLLIVDDNEEIRNILQEVFSPLYTVYTAEDGEEAYEKVRTLQPDLVVSDIMMPKMPGTELCMKIKNNIETCHIPVILLTALGTPEHEMDGLRIGADSYIVKPFNVRRLVMQCNNLINTRQILQQKYARQPEVKAEKIATSALDKQFIERAVQITETNLDNPDFSVEMFAREMGCGRTVLFQKIKGITGNTPNNFIMNQRLKKAARLLLDAPEMNITDIAYNLNFGNPQYFNKCFKELFGTSPSQYRKNSAEQQS
ncbi:hybrid sensor histidine kinase/response regulator transcription factor [uncultured Bacteroides sp.]|uniref:hybrid sensor histidine kinase/response regulator transcription factor n=1 Tax=uncultured Bacteroides sp. TaxID=162156 RepID=UPI0025D45382|nr:hybrid sensor histidine kinase/response regulator transcription factor [uncultured Bacteroides sp.]